MLVFEGACAMLTCRASIEGYYTCTGVCSAVIVFAVSANLTYSTHLVSNMSNDVAKDACLIGELEHVFVSTFCRRGSGSLVVFMY